MFYFTDRDGTLTQLFSEAADRLSERIALKYVRKVVDTTICSLLGPFR